MYKLVAKKRHCFIDTFSHSRPKLPSQPHRTTPTSITRVKCLELKTRPDPQLPESRSFCVKKSAELCRRNDAFLPHCRIFGLITTSNSVRPNPIWRESAENLSLLNRAEDYQANDGQQRHQAENRSQNRKNTFSIRLKQCHRTQNERKHLHQAESALQLRSK